MKIKYILILYLIIITSIASCNEDNSQKNNLISEILLNKGKNIKAIIQNYNFTPEKIIFTDSDLYYPLAKSYYNESGDDNNFQYFIKTAFNSKNIFQYEAFYFYISTLIEKQNYDELCYIIKNNQDLLDIKEKEFLLNFSQNKNIDERRYFPVNSNYFPLVFEIFKNNKETINMPENQNKIISFLINSFNNSKFPKKLENDLKDISNITENPIIDLIYYSYTDNTSDFNKTIFHAVNAAEDYEKIEFIKKYSIKFNSRKIFYNSIYKIKDKNKFSNYFYCTEKKYFEGLVKAHHDFQLFINKYPEKDQFYYNIKSDLLFGEYVFDTKWISEVVEFSKIFPNSYNSISLLNWVFRSALYQNKEKILIPFIEKIDFQSLNVLNKSILYYLCYLTDINSKEKWKQLIEKECPLSYSNLLLKKGNLNLTNLELPKIEENYSTEGKIKIKKINLLLNFDLTADANEIEVYSLTKIEKSEIFKIFYDYYIENEDFYEGLKYSSKEAENLYGENLYNIDLLTLKKLFPFHFKDQVLKYSEEYGIEPALSFAVMREESMFKKEIVSRANAQGLMQIMPATGKFISDKINMKDYDLSLPEDNIKMGIYYLKYLSEIFKDYPLLLISYNAGHGRARQWINLYKRFPPNIFYELIPNDESRHYIRKVLRSYFIYKYLLEKENTDFNVIVKDNRN